MQKRKHYDSRSQPETIVLTLRDSEIVNLAPEGQREPAASVALKQRDLFRNPLREDV